MLHFITQRTDHNHPRSKKTVLAVRQYLNYLKTNHIPVAIDLETTGLDPLQEDILLVAVGDDNHQFIIDATSIDLPHLFSGFENLVYIAHNAKFDYKFLKQANVGIRRFYDTMIVEQIISQGDKTRSAALDAVALRRAKVKLSKGTREEFQYMVGDSSTVFEPRHIVYAGEDIKYLHKIRRKQMDLVYKYDLRNRLAIELPLIPVIGDMELRGINLDKISWEDNIRINEKLLNDLQVQMDTELQQQAIAMNVTMRKYLKVRASKSYVVTDLFGDDKIVHAQSEVNINYGSPQQIKDIFTDFGMPVPMDKHGKITVGREVMQQYNILHYNNPLSDFINLYLQYIKVRKKLTSFGENFLHMIHPVSGAIHTMYKQCSTATGRFASGDTKNGHPNMAQIPRENQYRIPFKARPGYKMMTIDFSGCELTILASESKDKKLISLLMDDDKDMHSYLANACWRVIKKDPDYEVSKDERTQFKGVNFGMVYGATTMRIASLLNIPLSQAEQIEQTLRLEIPDVFNYLDSVSQQAVQDGYVIFNTRTKSRRWFKEVLTSFGGEPLDKTTRGNVERAAKNAPIQGTNADMMKESMVVLNKYFRAKALDAHILLQVYDELVIEVREDLVHKLAPKIQEMMNGVADKYLDTSLGIHMSSDFKIDKNWVK